MFSPELVRVTEWKLIPHLRKPVTRLSELAGVGPATASAILAALRPDLYPFFDEVVAAAIPGLGKAVFTPSCYEKYQARLRERARELSVACPDIVWTAHLVGVALWSASEQK